MFTINDLRGDLIIKACLRSDLAPIPFTFEATVRVTQDNAVEFQDGAVITVNNNQFQIVKAEPVRNVGGGPQGKEPINAVKLTAFPVGIVMLGKPRTTAVILSNGSLAGIFRACGATVPITGDFAIGSYACLVGGIPTYDLARVLQEESSVVMWRKNTIQAMSIANLMAQTPVQGVDTANSEDVKSDFKLAHEIPVFYSVAPDGTIIAGTRTDAAQSMAYVPRKDLRALNSMGRVLIRRKVITGKVNPTLRAGDVVNVAGTPMAIMTAALFSASGTDGGETTEYSRLWLGVSS